MKKETKKICEKKLRIETNSMSLHVIAMVFMFFDHLWGTIVPGNDWLTCIGLSITFIGIGTNKNSIIGFGNYIYEQAAA